MRAWRMAELNCRTGELEKLWGCINNEWTCCGIMSLVVAPSTGDVVTDVVWVLARWGTMGPSRVISS